METSEIHDISLRIRELRICHGLSREHVSSRLELSITQYDSFEDGQRDVPAGVLYRLCRLYGLSFDALADSPHAACLPAVALTDETADLIREYRQIRSPELRQKVMQIIRDIGIEQPRRKLFTIYGNRLGMGFPKIGNREP